MSRQNPKKQSSRIVRAIWVFFGFVAGTAFMVVFGFKEIREVIPFVAGAAIGAVIGVIIWPKPKDDNRI